MTLKPRPELTLTVKSAPIIQSHISRVGAIARSAHSIVVSKALSAIDWIWNRPIRLPLMPTSGRRSSMRKIACRNLSFWKKTGLIATKTRVNTSRTKQLISSNFSVTNLIRFLGEALIENSVGEKNVDFALDLTSGWKAPKDCAEEMVSYFSLYPLNYQKLAVEFLLWYSEARKMKRFPFDILMYLGKDNMGKYKISATTSMYAPYVFSVYDKTDVYNNYMKIDWKIFANFLVKSPPVDTANPCNIFWLI